VGKAVVGRLSGVVAAEALGVPPAAGFVSWPQPASRTTSTTATTVAALDAVMAA
jgi:hypothetical protein